MTSNGLDAIIRSRPNTGTAIVRVVIQTEIPPIRQDESGALPVGDWRVLLEMVIQEFPSQAA